MSESREDVTTESVIGECGSCLGYTMQKTEKQAITSFIHGKDTFIALSQLRPFLFCLDKDNTSSTKIDVIIHKQT